MSEIRLCECGHGPRLHADETPGREAPSACHWTDCDCMGYRPRSKPVCDCGHAYDRHHRKSVTGAATSPCGPGGPLYCQCLDYHAAGTPPTPPRVPAFDALLKGRADLAHAIASACQRGALITIGPWGAGDDPATGTPSAIRVSIDYRGNLITGTMVDPFEALALALSQWVRIHG